ncbi:hypothetical protein Q5M87_04425 [Brachyspira innocens]|uniref:CHRD domain-containing protein n=1 Tax=Brachyspira innocens TaxID=13264 RepID=A0ABT8YUN1_9SPIR|nr:hypothetical protein [Brachyspira innocens]MDO6993248.1 hypothetical protein [Brachyspira innocens]MDO7019574.1 hypothetical protein [Brachyspira innocens]
MKFLKYILIICTFLFVFSCKKTNLTVTEPGPDYILSKLMNGIWDGVNISGDILNFNGQDYKFEDSLLGIAGIFANENEYVIAAPLGNLVTITTDGGSTDGVKEIIDIVGQQNAVGVINGIASSEDPSNIKAEDLIGSAQVTEEEKNRIEEILGGLSFGKVETVPSK